MTPVRIQACRHLGVQFQHMRQGATLTVDLDMTPAQRLANVAELLSSGMSEQEAFEGLRAIFPAWFLEEQPA